MVKIKMLVNKLGASDGFTTKMYNKDDEYEVSTDLADVFVAEKAAELVVAKAEAKAEKGSVANKAETGAPENKGK